MKKLNLDKISVKLYNVGIEGGNICIIKPLAILF